jgi:expansin (peptidoglycan-binding protein)
VRIPADPADALVFKNSADYGTWNLSTTGVLTYTLAGGTGGAVAGDCVAVGFGVAWIGGRIASLQSSPFL